MLAAAAMVALSAWQADRFDPFDNTRAGATLLTETQVFHALSVLDAADWHRLELGPGTATEVALEVQRGDASLVVTDSSGQPASSGVSAVGRRVVSCSAEARTLYVKVEVKPKEASCRYTLTRRDWSPVDAWDPGDNAAGGATALASPDIPPEGVAASSESAPHRLSCLDREDWFVMPVGAGFRYSFVLRYTSGSEARIETHMVGPAQPGQVLEVAHSLQADGTIVPTTDGICYVRVTLAPTQVDEVIYTVECQAARAAVPVARVAATPLEGPAPLTVHFDASGSTTAGGAPASYEWDYDDGAPVETTAGAASTHTFSESGDYNVALVIADPQGNRSLPTTLRVSVEGRSSPHQPAIGVGLCTLSSLSSISGSPAIALGITVGDFGVEARYQGRVMSNEFFDMHAGVVAGRYRISVEALESVVHAYVGLGILAIILAGNMYDFTTATTLAGPLAGVEVSLAALGIPVTVFVDGLWVSFEGQGTWLRSVGARFEIAF